MSSGGWSTSISAGMAAKVAVTHLRSQNPQVMRTPSAASVMVALRVGNHSFASPTEAAVRRTTVCGYAVVVTAAETAASASGWSRAVKVNVVAWTRLIRSRRKTR